LYEFGKRENFEELHNKLIEEWNEIEFNKFLFVSASDNCDINYDIPFEDGFFAWPAHLHAPTQISVTQVDGLMQLGGSATGAGSIDIAAMGEPDPTLYGYEPYRQTCRRLLLHETVDSPLVFDFFSGGSSYAVPLVSGVAALVLSRDLSIRGNSLEVKNRVLSGAEGILDPVRVNGGRLLNACGALTGDPYHPSCLSP
jgi:hypothetical protein